MSRLDDLATRLREELAAIEHERWVDWQKWMHSKCEATQADDGSLLIPAALVERWERQIVTPYAELPEEEKHSDREQVDRYWALIEAYIAAWQAPDQRPDAVTISDAMVERAAEKMWELATGETWLRIGWGGPAKPPYINDARAVLEAALAPETPDGQ